MSSQVWWDKEESLLHHNNNNDLYLKLEFACFHYISFKFRQVIGTAFVKRSIKCTNACLSGPIIVIEWTATNYERIDIAFIPRYDFALLVVCRPVNAVAAHCWMRCKKNAEWWPFCFMCFFADKYNWLSRARPIPSEDNANFSHFRSISHSWCSQHCRNSCLPWK
jgi:hypothetical protein